MKTNIGNRIIEGIVLLLVLLVAALGEVKPVYAAPPFNDNIVSAAVVAALPYADSVDTSDATLEISEPFYDCSWNVGATVWYRYTPPGSGDVFITTTGSDFPTTVHVFDESSMIPIDCEDDSTDPDLLFYATAGTTYLISVGGYNLESGNLVFNMVEPLGFTTCAAVDVTQVECNALDAFFTATTGGSWTANSNWFASNLVCSWFGVVCKSGAVSRLELNNNNLAGVLNVDLTSVSNLRTLNIASNNLTGDMPTIIGFLPTGMSYLYFSGNSFTGTIPPTISNFTSLRALGVFDNLLSGDIGTVFSNLPGNLGYFAFNQNSFYGTIPPITLSLPLLWRLDGGGNSMTGDIGTVMGNLPTSLIYLNLNGNDFTGRVPSSISSFTSLVDLDLGFNELSGDLQSLIINLPSGITDLDLGGNNFTGTIPTEISNISGLRNFSVLGNPLGGTIPISITGLSLNVFDFQSTFLCEPTNGSYAPWKAGVTFYYPGHCEPSTFLLFEDDFETGDFTLWTRFNDGNGYLTACNQAANNGAFGACVARGTDKRKQLIDETPVNKTTYNVRFNFDINSLSMTTGTRFRFLQVKMGAERPFFIVLKYQGGQYQIQLNVLLDDLTKVKTGWYPLSNAPHVIEVDWISSFAAGNDNGLAALFIDDELQELLTGLDNDTIDVAVFKIGFTSRLDDKPISGIFYLDDIATSDNGHLGLP